MTWRWLLVVAAVAAGCPGGPLVDGRRFACRSAEDCADGFVCLDVGSGPECVSSLAAGGVAGGGPPGGGASGGVAGGTGGGSGGGAAGGDAGGTGGGDAGGSAGGDAGGMAGGDVGGGATAGGSGGGSSGGTAGGSVGGGRAGGTSGGSTSGGTAGGATSGGRAGGTGGGSTGGGSTGGGFAGGAGTDGGSVGGGSGNQGPNLLVFINSPPTPLRGGQCFPVSWESRRGAMAAPVLNNTPITFTPTTGLKLYTDALCASAPLAAASTTLPGGMSGGTIYVRVLTTAPISFVASAPFGATAPMPLNALPMVRRDSCFFRAQVLVPLDAGVGDGGASDGGSLDAGFFADQELVRTCPIPGPALGSLGNAFLSMQVIGPQPGSHHDVMVRCRFTSSAAITCNRRQGEGPAEVRWQVVETGPQLRVQHVTSASCAVPPALLPTAVDPAKTFLLKSLQANSGGFFDDEDALPFAVAGPNLLSAPAGGCGGYDLEVVEWDGVSVLRDVVDGGFPAAVTTLTTFTASPAAQRVLLVQAGADVNGASTGCSLFVRGAMPGPSELQFSRSLGDAGCASAPLRRLWWERLNFNTVASVQEHTLVLPVGASSDVRQLMPLVDPARAFVLASNQSALGQALGETASPTSADPLPVETAFAFDLNDAGTQLTARRARATAAARVTVYVIQLE